MPPAPTELGAQPGELSNQPGDPVPIQPASPPTAHAAVLAGAAEAEPGDEPRPRALDPQQIGFTPQAPVPWLDPPLLARTAIRVGLADTFAAYLDKRELQALLPGTVFDERPTGTRGEPDDTGAVWFDYVADVGDGFDPTYSVAYLLAKPSLQVGDRHLPRGRMLIIGGDEVYPTASSPQYDDRFRGPYRAALPQPPPEGRGPGLYALPGNHDWYDGLTAFLRLFARSEETRIGGWSARQSRSYFTIQLPHRWWLFAIDAQGDAYIDDPQLRYFKEAAKALREGDKVIVCTPNPSWVQATREPRAYSTIDFFVRTIIAPTKARVPLMLSGDWHHYARYHHPDRELITAGGGGAYLYPTHQLPKTIQVPPLAAVSRNASPTKEYGLAQTYPTKLRSAAYAAGVFTRLPMRNPRFVALLGAVHVLLMLAWVNVVQEREAGMDQRLAWVPLGTMILIVMAATIGFASAPGSDRSKPRRYLLGILHGSVHIGLGCLGALLWIQLTFFQLRVVEQFAVAVLVYLIPSGVAASQIVAGYLLLASRWHVNLNELFSSQGIVDAKAFLRLHIDETGALTIYPIAVPHVGRRWNATPSAPAESPWFEPDKPIAVEFAEEPFTIR
jgi:hypothetical protein